MSKNILNILLVLFVLGCKSISLDEQTKGHFKGRVLSTNHVGTEIDKDGFKCAVWKAEIQLIGKRIVSDATTVSGYYFQNYHTNYVEIVNGVESHVGEFTTISCGWPRIKTNVVYSFYFKKRDLSEFKNIFYIREVLQRTW